ncbi:MAG TPA: rhamnulose-1-phosphate aldolase [Acholeplasma sp.]|nr:rhamnulose-1-phosphate aldolase [Acholeplasma sp.]
MKVIEYKTVSKFTKIIKLMYDLGWAERNAGNVSHYLTEEEIKQFDDLKEGAIHDLDVVYKDLIGKHFLITGTGKFFRNIEDNVEDNIGIVKILPSGNQYQIVWGLNNSKPTSEISTHLYSHQARLSVDPKNRVIIHTHATYINVMSRVIHPLDEKFVSRTLWGINTENIVIFPEGLGIIPWLVPGNSNIGVQTAEKFKKYRIVLWPLHGVVSSGESLDVAFGLIETVEKAAKVFILSNKFENKRVISKHELEELSDAFNIKPNKEFLDEEN